MAFTKNIRPIVRIGQQVETTEKFNLTSDGHRQEPLNLINATNVEISLEHVSGAFTIVNWENCTISDPLNGEVEYTFTESDTTTLHGDYYVQFRVEYEDGESDLVPPDGYEWIVRIGRKQPSEPTPLEVSRLYADEATIGNLQVDNATIAEVVGDPEIDSLSMNTLSANQLGQNLNSNGYRITDIPAPENIRDAVAQEYVDNMAGENITGASNPATDHFDLNNYSLRNGENLEANSATIQNISGSIIAPNATTLQNQKRDWSWENIEWEDKGGPIIDHSTSSSPDGATYPTILNAGVALDNPIDQYYMYWSGHDTPCGMELSTAPHPWGPWTFHSTVIPGDQFGGGHVASPSALVDPSNDRLNLYVHSNDDGQQSYLMAAPLTGDGTTFTEVSTVLACPFDSTWDEQERSYLKVRRIGTTYWGVYQGRDVSNNIPGIGVCYSFDGETWQTDASPAFDNTQWMDYQPRSYQGGSPSLSTVGNIPYIHYGDRGDPSAARALPLADKDRALFQPGEEVMTVPSWSSSSGINVHEFWTDEQYIYAYYYVAEGLETEIGVARAELGGIFA